MGLALGLMEATARLDFANTPYTVATAKSSTTYLSPGRRRPGRVFLVAA